MNTNVRGCEPVKHCQATGEEKRPNKEQKHGRAAHSSAVARGNYWSIRVVNMAGREEQPLTRVLSLVDTNNAKGWPSQEGKQLLFVSLLLFTRVWSSVKYK